MGSSKSSKIAKSDPSADDDPSTKSTSTTPSSSPEPSSTTPSKKRKRPDPTPAELEVDITAPEPPSKKALRKQKKGKPTTSTGSTTLPPFNPTGSPEPTTTTTATTEQERSAHGIWIGNLAYTTTASEIRAFFATHASIENPETDITRIHLPGPSQQALMRRPTNGVGKKQVNRGFAYVDFIDAACLERAIAASEGLLAGRRVLIKDAKSFEGRPDPATVAAAVAAAAAAGEGEGAAGKDGGKPPSKRIFVGNLAFDVSREMLMEHFKRCGEVADAFVATFEDTGKCKGYGWVTFEDVESAGKAVRGWVEMEVGDEDENEDEEGGAETNGADEGVEVEEGDGGGEVEVKIDVQEDKENKAKKERKVKKKERKPRKWWVNRIAGRQLRMEFAEDKTTRYKKRFGKGGSAHKDSNAAEGGDASGDAGGVDGFVERAKGAAERVKVGRKPVPAYYERKVDARTIKPGAALAGAQRLTGAIVEGEGKKIKF